MSASTVLPAAATPGQASAVPSAAGAHPAARNNTGQAIAYMVVAVGLFAVMDAMVKWMGERYPTMEIIFFRSFFAFIPLAFLMFRHGVADAIRVRDPIGHLIRCVVGLIALSTFFFVFPRMPLADAIAITFAAPVFVTALSVPILAERVGLRRWSAVLVGFAGVLVMVQPGAGVFEPIAALMLFGTVFYALAMILVRRLARTETSTSIVFYFTLACTLVSAAFLPFQWVTPTLEDLAVLIGIGLVGGLAQITVTQAFRHGDVSVVAPFDYSAMIWAVLIGFLFWGEIPGNNIWIGAAVVMVSGLYIVYREASLGLPRGTARKLQTRR